MGKIKERDYTADKQAATFLAQRIQNRYRLKGYPNVKVWVEPIENFPGLWQIRSNIKFGAMV